MREQLPKIFATQIFDLVGPLAHLVIPHKYSYEYAVDQSVHCRNGSGVCDRHCVGL